MVHYGITEKTGAEETAGGRSLPLAKMENILVIRNDTAEVFSGVKTAIAVLANDSAPPGDTLHLVSAEGAGEGKLEITNNMLYYTTDAGYEGADSFTYHVVDDFGNRASGEAVIRAHVSDGGKIPVAEKNGVFQGTAGDDLLLGSGGDDVLIGGGGADNFRFTPNFGHDVVADFTFGTDTLTFRDIFGALPTVKASSVAEIQALAHNYGVQIADAGHDAVTIVLTPYESVTLLNAGHLFGFAPFPANTTGSSANDTLLGTSAPAGHLVAGNGDDRIIGGSGSARIEAGAGNDTVIGGAGDDTISGQQGNDVLFGGAGHNLLDGGTGNDILTGGAQADVLLFKSGFGHDTVTNFSLSEGDRFVFFAGAVDTHNIRVDNLNDLHHLIAMATGVTEHGHDLTLAFGTNSLTLEGWAHLV